MKRLLPRNEGGLRFPAWWSMVGMLLTGSIICMSLIPSPALPGLLAFPAMDKVLHLAAYGGIVFWFCQIYRRNSTSLLIAAILTSLGILLEILQDLTGYRTFEYLDMAANTLGVILGFCLTRTRLGSLLACLEVYLITPARVR